MKKGMKMVLAAVVLILGIKIIDNKRAERIEAERLAALKAENFNTGLDMIGGLFNKNKNKSSEQLS